MRFIFTAFLVLFLQACSIATGPKFSDYAAIEPDFAQLYVIRTEDGQAFKQFGGGMTGSYPTIVVNDKELGELKRGGYLTTRINVGLVTVTTQSGLNWWLEKQTVSFTAQAGRRYFIHLNTGYKGMSATGRQVGVAFTEVGEDFALPILKQLTLSN